MTQDEAILLDGVLKLAYDINKNDEHRLLPFDDPMLDPLFEREPIPTQEDWDIYDELFKNSPTYKIFNELYLSAYVRCSDNYPNFLGFIKITNTGKKFLLDGGYQAMLTRQAKEQKWKDEIHLATLASTEAVKTQARNSNKALVISWTALILSVIAILMDFLWKWLSS